MVIEELKQEVIAKKTKVKRYEQRISEFKQNQLFLANSKQVHKKRKKQGERVIPNFDNSINLLRDI